MAAGVPVGVPVGIKVGMMVGTSVVHWHDWISARSAPISRRRSPI
jgi:hypothetical protein